jgi:hypothetical protein
MSLITNYRRKAPALEAGVRKYIFCPLPNGFKAPKFIYEKQRNTASLLNPLNLFMGIPPASCLLPPASLRIILIFS